jgi:trimethylamine:corrinoid methyltransferase-like protein
MLSNLDILTKEVLERLQAASYHIPDRLGVRVPHKAILERLAGAGATADFDRQVVRLPPRPGPVSCGSGRQAAYSIR